MSPSKSLNADGDINTLLKIMTALRDKESGCPWDIEQTFSTIAPYTIEEAYEVADAIDREDMDDLKSELGDLLFQAVFHSQIASEQGEFEFTDVVKAINAKMISRHPHVFSDTIIENAEAQTQAWEETKARERADKSSDLNDIPGALEGVASTLPSLIRAEKLQKRAARTGFDWKDKVDIFEKIQEEIEEVNTAIENNDQSNIEEEIGDLLFVCVNLARKLGVDSELALKAANTKFETRFRGMELLAATQNKDFSSLELDEQEALWQSVKAQEKG